MLTTGECTKCWLWSYTPENFDERKHFLVCPNCDGNMYLKRHSYGVTISDAMRPSEKVVATKVRKAK